MSRYIEARGPWLAGFLTRLDALTVHEELASIILTTATRTSPSSSARSVANASSQSGQFMAVVANSSSPVSHSRTERPHRPAIIIEWGPDRRGRADVGGRAHERYRSGGRRPSADVIRHSVRMTTVRKAALSAIRPLALLALVMMTSVPIALADAGPERSGRRPADASGGAGLHRCRPSVPTVDRRYLEHGAETRATPAPARWRASRPTPTTRPTSPGPKPSSRRWNRNWASRGVTRYAPDLAGGTAVMYNVDDSAGESRLQPSSLQGHRGQDLLGDHHQLGRPRDQR